MREQIEKLLLEKGVSPKHIEQMKIETSINIHQYLEDYESTDVKEIEVVATHKIKGIGGRIEDVEERISVRINGEPVVTPAYTVDYNRLSWFDYISMKDKQLPLDRQRILNIYEKFSNATLEQNYAYYEKDGSDPGSGSLTRLIYFMDEDIYAPSGDGTHRTLWAKVSNAPFLRAEVTYYKRKNSD